MHSNLSCQHIQDLANSAHLVCSILLDSLNFQDPNMAEDAATYTRAYSQHVNH